MKEKHQMAQYKNLKETQELFQVLFNQVGHGNNMIA